MSSYPLSGVRTGEHKEFRPILKKWIGVVNALANEWAPEDVPWWHTEMALVGTFSAAAWLCGGRALEEYISNKKGRGKRRKLDTTGRVDLWIVLKNNQFLIEAKSYYVAVRDKGLEGQKKRILKKLDEAHKDTRRAPTYGEATRLGMLFVVPYQMRDKGTLTAQQIRQWLHVLDGVKSSALAWTFPVAARNVQTPDSNGKTYVYPGVIILLKR